MRSLKTAVIIFALISTLPALADENIGSCMIKIDCHHSILEIDNKGLHYLINSPLILSEEIRDKIECTLL